MLIRLIAVLTLAATLLHSVLGCCWHHQHHVSAAACTAKVALRSDGCTHCHHHSDGQTSEPRDAPADDQHGKCHERACVYVVAKHFELPVAMTLALPIAIELMEAPLAPACDSGSLVREMLPPWHRAPELRALLQVWLI